MHDWYDWLKDIGLPALVGLGSIGVGAVAIVVARQSHELAMQVRQDEGKRDDAAARERYRDQLFRSIEPAVSAILAHRAEILRVYRINVPSEGLLRAATVSRLWLVAVVTSESDARLVHASRKALDGSLATGRGDVTAYVLGELSLMLPALLHDDRDVDDLVKQTEEIVSKAIEYCDARPSDLSPPATPA